MNAKKITKDKTVVNKVLDEFDVSRHTRIAATVVDGNKGVGLEAPSCGLSSIEGRVNVEMGDIPDGECNQYVDMEGMQSNPY